MFRLKSPADFTKRAKNIAKNIVKLLLVASS